MSQRNTDNPSDLLKDMRRFWFNNEPGTFQLGDRKVTRREIQIYGGPAPQFNFCGTCQQSEWLSRLEQRNLFQSHSCDTSERCQWLCSVQGDELWTIHHQNFWYAVGYDPDLQAPKGIIFYDKGPGGRFWYTRFWVDNCDNKMVEWRRAAAQAFQYELVEEPPETDWSRYDFMYARVCISPITRPDIPIMVLGEDYVNKEWMQGILDWLQPDIMITPYPTAWSQFNSIGKIIFHHRSPSSFFTRPNVRGEKKFDLLVIGNLTHGIYDPRRELHEQLQPLENNYRIKFDYHSTLHQKHPGPVEFMHGDEKVHYLNKWSEYLGSAKFATFGPTGPPCHEKLMVKNFECMGSGAISILPEVTDLTKYLTVGPDIHYIPQGSIWKNNNQLRHYLDHYEDYIHIAEAATKWHAENMDRMLFDDFEDAIMELTGYKYPRRLID